MPNRIARMNESHVIDLMIPVFRKAGWKVERELSSHGRHVDLFVRKGDLAYAVEFKRSSEGRSDRLVPLLSQAILQAQGIAKLMGPKVSPMAIVFAPKIPESAVSQLRDFASANAPEVAIGLIDLEGLRHFDGRGLESLNRKPDRPVKDIVPLRAPSKIGLFSGVNQWLLKVLLAENIPDSQLSSPREEYRNASQLAKASGVSIMSAFRFVKQLREEGFLNESEACLRLVRVKELMQRWRDAAPNWRELRMKWLIRNDDQNAIYSAIRGLLSNSNPPRLRHLGFARPNAQQQVPHRIRVCVGLFSAAKLLGLSFVHGGPQHLYVEESSAELFQVLGLVKASEHEPVDVFVRVPMARSSIFRAAVNVDGIPVCDVIQVWLDVSAIPARGSAQADEIWRRVLAPALGVR
ncbi:MAG: hypothetical protein ACM3JB_06895 [Acidobacteriaceae bacterium]